MSLPAVGKNFTLKQEQKARSHWFNRESKSPEVLYTPPLYQSVNKTVEDIILEYLKEDIRVKSEQQST